MIISKICKKNIYIKLYCYKYEGKEHRRVAASLAQCKDKISIQIQLLNFIYRFVTGRIPATVLAERLQYLPVRPGIPGEPESPGTPSAPFSPG